MKLVINLTANGDLRHHVMEQLRGFDVNSINPEGRKHAAVAITIVTQRAEADIGNIPFKFADADQAALILTIRTSSLKKHAGQRAFPGGHLDPGETPEQAALRELEEEVGLKLSPGDVLGRLDDYSTRSGFLITPVVIWGGAVDELRANPDEVESIHRIPVSELLRDDAPILEPLAGCEHPALKMPLGNDWVAAPTGALAYQFREVAILGKPTRVAHFEQPHFAWS